MKLIQGCYLFNTLARGNWSQDCSCAPILSSGGKLIQLYYYAPVLRNRSQDYLAALQSVWETEPNVEYYCCPHCQWKTDPELLQYATVGKLKIPRLLKIRFQDYYWNWRSQDYFLFWYLSPLCERWEPDPRVLLVHCFFTTSYFSGEKLVQDWYCYIYASVKKLTPELLVLPSMSVIPRLPCTSPQ